MSNSTYSPLPRPTETQLGKRPCGDDDIPSANSMSPPNPNKDEHDNKKHKKQGTNRSGCASDAKFAKLRRSLSFMDTTTDTSGSFTRTMKEVENRLENIRASMAEVDRLFNKQDNMTLVKKEGTPKGKIAMNDITNKNVGVACNTIGSPTMTKKVEENVFHIIVSSGEQGDEGVRFYMAETSTFGFIYREYAFRINTSTDKFVLKKGVRTVDEDMSAGAAGVKDGDILVARGLESTVNTNTFLCTVNFYQLKEVPLKKLTLKLPIDSTIVDLYREWANFVGIDVNSFWLVHDEFPLLKCGTLSGNSLKNGCNIYCVRYNATTEVGVTTNSESF